MSLRWSSYVAPKPQRGLKTQDGHFPSKIAIRLKKVCYKVIRAKTISDKVVLHSLTYSYPCKYDWWGRHILPEILGQTDRVGAKSPIFDLFSLVAPAVTASEKVQLALIGSQLRAFQWAQDEHRTLFLSPPRGGGGSKTQSVQNLKAAITPKVPKRYEIGFQLINH